MILYVGLPPLMLVVAAFILVILTLITRRKIIYDVYALLFSLSALILTILVFKLVYEGGKPAIYSFGGWPPPIGIFYEVDFLGAFLGVVVGVVMFLVVLYSIWYTGGLSGFEYYYALLLGMEAGMLGCIYTGDVFNLFVMFEVLAISCYGLVGFYRSKPAAVEAAIKYALIGALATTLYFLGLVFIYGSFGTLNMADLALKSRIGSIGYFPYSGFPISDVRVGGLVALALALWAFTFKAALFPSHFWLPDAHPEAPTPISAALSGLVVKIGVYATVRFLYTIFSSNSLIAKGFLQLSPWSLLTYILLALGLLSGVLGALLMAIQIDVKRLLAYSTISHVGLIFMGIATGSGYGLAASTYHIMNHALGKALLFMSTGILVKMLNTRNLDELAGSGRFYPTVTIATILGILHMIGVPPFSGFYSKLLLYTSLFEMGGLLLASSIIIVSVISIFGYAKIIYSLMFKSPTSIVNKPPIEKNRSVSILMLIIGLATFILGLFADTIITVVFKVAENLSENGVAIYIQSALTAIQELSPGS
ncbi:MAG: proton-conducting transporter membrane subunit [Candidatus Methanomethylicia archaeon]